MVAVNKVVAGRKRVFAEAGFVVMWSSGFIGASLGTQAAGTATVLAWRFFIAAVVLLGFALTMRRAWPSARGLLHAGVVGVLSQCVYLGGVVGAVEMGVSAGTTALVAALQPLLSASLAAPVLGEKVFGRQWVGLGVGLMGVAFVVGGGVGGEAPVWAYALPFAGMAGLVAATFVERVGDGTAPEMTLDVSLAIQCAVSAVVFGVAAYFQGSLAPPGGFEFWGAIAWLVVLSNFGGYGFYWLNVRMSSVTRVGSLVYLTPPTTMVWAFLMFGEEVGAFTILGLAVCVLGVWLARE